MTQKSTQLPFSVSARTARLIGRENVAQAESAVIELVKNAYDADAPICLVLFDNRYSEVPEMLTQEEYEKFSKEEKLVENSYDEYDHSYKLKLLLEDSHKDLQRFFAKKCDIYIVDNGEGMTTKVLEDYWMTIGTDNKLYDIKTSKNRIKVGAKGIGRFALDRLGSKTEMWTFSEDKKNKNYWVIDWSQFDKPKARLNDIYASLERLEKVDLDSFLDLEISKQIQKILPKFQKGTILKVSNSRDVWDRKAINSLFEGMQGLTPPEGHKFFQIHLNVLKGESFGIVNKQDPVDYDYRVDAKMDENQNLKIRVFRKEFDGNKIPKSFFSNKDLKKFEHMKPEYFNEDSSFDLQLTAKNLLPGESNNEYSYIKQIGPFSFTFFFGKATFSKTDQNIYKYRSFNQKSRSAWFDQFGGIRIYRDSFLVRPYGRKDNYAFDWLELGKRVALSPAGLGKGGGGFRVRPHQVAGLVSISRIDNSIFDDQANREGIQENRVFVKFKELLIAIINRTVEKDRSFIGVNLKKISEEENKDESKKQDATRLAQEFTKEPSTLFKSSEDAEKIKTLSEGTLLKDEELKEKDRSLRMSRALSSTGLIVTSLAHELRHLGNTLTSRVVELEEVLKKCICDEKIKELEQYENPYTLLSDMKEQDEQLSHWLNFALGAVSSDKRTKKDILLEHYFDQLGKNWNAILRDRKVQLRIDMKNPEMKVYTHGLDLDSIFNNLITNSLDAFMREGFTEKRIININGKLLNTSEIQLLYSDSGPGLLEEIDDPDIIFQELFTTKRVNGEKIGVGLGMSIVKSIIEANKGDVEIISRIPFEVKMLFKKES